MAKEPARRTAQVIAEEIAKADGVDVAIYNGPISRFFDEDMIANMTRRRRRPNLLMIVVTEGGDADAGFRMSRCLQGKYEKFSLFVSGYCKSAGTLLAIGAHELVYSDHGELGPLDVQMTKKDELLDRQSGLTVVAAMDFLRDKAYSAFNRVFFDLEETTGGIVTVQTASKIAVEIVTGLFSPISSQIDPLHVGEVARAIRIAEQYGVRLAAHSKSIDRDGLTRLLTGYATHGFVIDRLEAEKIFKNVREATALELELAEVLGSHARRPLALRAPNPNPHFEFLSPEVATGASHEKRNAKAPRRSANAGAPGLQHERVDKGAGSRVRSRRRAGSRIGQAGKGSSASEARKIRRGNGLVAN